MSNKRSSDSNIDNQSPNKKLHLENIYIDLFSNLLKNIDYDGNNESINNILIECKNMDIHNFGLNVDIIVYKLCTHFKDSSETIKKILEYIINRNNEPIPIWKIISNENILDLIMLKSGCDNIFINYFPQYQFINDIESNTINTMNQFKCNQYFIVNHLMNYETAKIFYDTLKKYTDIGKFKQNKLKLHIYSEDYNSVYDLKYSQFVVQTECKNFENSYYYIKSVNTQIFRYIIDNYEWIDNPDTININTYIIKFAIDAKDDNFISMLKNTIKTSRPHFFSKTISNLIIKKHNINTLFDNDKGMRYDIITYLMNKSNIQLDDYQEHTYNLIYNTLNKYIYKSQYSHVCELIFNSSLVMHLKLRLIKNLNIITCQHENDKYEGGRKYFHSLISNIIGGFCSSKQTPIEKYENEICMTTLLNKIFNNTDIDTKLDTFENILFSTDVLNKYTVGHLRIYITFLIQKYNIMGKSISYTSHTNIMSNINSQSIINCIQTVHSNTQ
jgi:hypothetical protein